MASLDGASFERRELSSRDWAAGELSGKSRRSSRRRWLAVAALGLCGWLIPRGMARSAATEVADTSARAREEAVRLLPLNELTAESRRKILAVCENPSIFRRLPQKTVDCDNRP